MKARRTGQEERVDVFAVVAESHLVGSEADGVLAGRDAVKLFEVGLVDASQRRVDLDGVWTARRGLGEGSIRLFGKGEVSGGGLSSSSGTDASDSRIPTFCGRVAGFGWCGWKREADISIGIFSEVG